MSLLAGGDAFFCLLLPLLSFFWSSLLNYEGLEAKVRAFFRGRVRLKNKRNGQVFISMTLV